jgi:uncharacterized membrane protein YgcG
MSRARTLLLALVGLAFPVGLGLAVYVTSASSLAAVPTVISAPEQIGRSATQTEPTTSSSTAPTTTDDDRDEPRNEDLPGKCKDPDHALDPDCDPPTADDDSSGPGSGSDGSSGSGSNSGSGSDSSGRGSGDD